MRKYLAALIFVAISAVALAQSNPGFVPGQVPTAAQWNGYFTGKQDVLSFSSLVSILGFTPLNPANNLGDVSNTTTSRNNLLTYGPFTTSTVYLPSTVNLSNTSTFFDGPSYTATAGTWLAMGQVEVLDPNAATYTIKLWDGTTTAAAGLANASASTTLLLTLSGILTNPAGNIRISVRDSASVSGTIRANGSGLSLDSYLTVIRLQ